MATTLAGLLGVFAVSGTASANVTDGGFGWVPGGRKCWEHSKGPFRGLWSCFEDNGDYWTFAMVFRSPKMAYWLWQDLKKEGVPPDGNWYDDLDEKKSDEEDLDEEELDEHGWNWGSTPSHSWILQGNTVQCQGVIEQGPVNDVIVWSCNESGSGEALGTISFATQIDAPPRIVENYYRTLRAQRLSGDTHGFIDCGDESGVHPSIWEPEPTLTEQYSDSGSLNWGDSYYSGLAGYDDDPYARQGTTSYDPYGGRTTSYSPYGR